MIKRGFYYLACAMFMLNLLLWAMFIYPNISTEEIIHGDSRIGGEIFSFIVLMAIPVVIFVCLHRILKWRIYAAFGILHYYDPSIKQLRKLRIGDTIQFVTDKRPFVNIESIYTITDIFTHATCPLNLRFKTFSKGFELTGSEGDKLFLSLVGQDKIKISKKIDIKVFLDLIEPLTESELQKRVVDQKSIHINDKYPDHLYYWIFSGEHLFVLSKVAHLKKNARSNFAINNAPKSNVEDFYYCFTSAEIVYRRRSTVRDYDCFPTHYDTGFEIKLRKGMLEDVRVTYTTNILDYKDYIHLNPKMEEAEVFC